MKETMLSMLLVASIAAGCAAEGGAPFHRLDLRDALRADPEVIAQLDASELEVLAQRLEEARGAQRAADTTPRTSAETAIGHAIAYDERREAASEEALVAIAIEERTLELEIRTLGGDPDAGLPAGPELVVDDTILAEEPYASAIADGAREPLLEVAAASGASRLRSARNVPFGVLADGDTLHVNLAWLVALSARSEGGITAEVGRSSAALDTSPYRLYASLDACVSSVEDACEGCVTGAMCSGAPNLSDFETVAQECAFLGATADGPALLCVVGLMSVNSVSSCVRRTEPSCPSVDITPAVASLESARAFLSRAECVAALEACANQRAPVASSSSDCDASCDSPDCALNCDDAFSGCSACADATSSTATSCNDTCDSCSSSSSDCELCAVVPEGSSRRSSPLALVWLAVPLLYLLGAGRRR